MEQAMVFNQNDLELYLCNRLPSKTVQYQYKRVIALFCSEVIKSPKDSEEFRKLVETYNATLPAHQRNLSGAALRAFFEFITNERYSSRCKPSDYIASEAIDAEINLFEKYLNSNTFLVESSKISAILTVRHFLCFTFGGSEVALPSVDEHKVLRFLFIEKKHLKTASKRTLVVRLRIYARFLADRGFSNAERVLGMPLNMPNWSQADIPKTLTLSQVEAIKSTAASSRRAPLRNTAIVTCLANLGLRTCEVAAIKLGDVDFREGILTVRETKSGMLRALPLDRETGTAIEKYVMSERPPIGGTLFLRHLHDIGSPMGIANLRMTIRHVAYRAGIEPFGLHMLRHTAASRMVNGGIPLKVISDVLGHEAIQSTTIYAKVDDVHLRQACAPWPGDDDE